MPRLLSHLFLHCTFLLPLHSNASPINQPVTNQKQQLNQPKNTMTQYSCEYCGTKSSSISSLTAAACHRHPNGPLKGKHKLYEGSQKASYSCKYCGTSSSSLASLTAAACPRHPSGPLKGKHAPAL